MTDIAATPRVVGIDVARTHLDLHLLPDGRAWRIACTPGDLAGVIDVLAAQRVELVVMEASGGYARLCAAMRGCVGRGGSGRCRRQSAADAALRRRPWPARQDRCHRCRADRRLCRTDPPGRAPPPRSGAPPPGRAGRPPPPAGRHGRRRTPARRPRPSRRQRRRRHRTPLALPRTGPFRHRTPHRRMHRRPSALVAPHHGPSGDQGRRPADGHRPRHSPARTRHHRTTADRSPCRPCPHQQGSGTTRGRRFVQRGRTTLRTALHLAALCAARFNPDLKTFYQRPSANGKPPKTALIAVARKLLTILNAVAKQSLQNA